jgi:hypothetical protein
MSLSFYVCLALLSQPAIELPPEIETSTPTAEPAEPAEPKTLLERTLLGSYGELALEYLSVGPDAPFNGTATLRRLVLFVMHNFSENVRGMIELEWENAIACASCNGSVEVEQAFVDWKLAGDDLMLRAGLVLIPMGIVNEQHEPPVYHGVARPRFDQLIIPSTWRELGVGVAGKFSEAGKFQLYLTTPLDVVQLGPAGLAPARTIGSFSPANGFMVSGRAELEPMLGVVVGISAIAGDLGGGSRFFDENGAPRDLAFPLVGVSADARWRRDGLEARAVGAVFFFPESDALIDARRADGSPFFPDPQASGVPATRIAGAYGELAYDVFELLLDTEQSLLPFARLEWYDTQSRVPAPYARDPRFGVVEWTFGLTYRPIVQVVAKMDYQLRDRRLGLDEKQLNFGLGYMF